MCIVSLHFHNGASISGAHLETYVTRKLLDKLSHCDTLSMRAPIMPKHHDLLPDFYMKEKLPSHNSTFMAKDKE